MIRLSTRPHRAGYLLFALVGLAQLLCSEDAQGFDGHGVAWRSDLGSAQAEARQKDLPLWVQFTGPWCVNCKRMDRGAFLHPLVVAASTERFIPVKVRSDEYEQLALSLGLTVLPSTVIVKPSGEVIDKWEGFGEPGEFLNFLEETLIRDGRLPRSPRKDGPPEIALASYCPVSLVDRRRLVPGQTTLVEKHGGFEYRFADEAARVAFRARPEKYVPVNRGDCPVRQVDGGRFKPGDPRFGVLYRGHLYLCADGSERDRFLKNPERYANVDLGYRLHCLHCVGEKPGREVAQSSGRPAPSTTTRRTLLPPPSAVMEAFLTPVLRLTR
jgi:YHS domain-containing protein/thiol-disulfide isomerase/thioredoxin